MPRHPPNALKALDHSHYRCPSFLRARGAKGATAFGYLSAFGCAPAALRRSCETSGGQHTRLVRRVLGLSIKERPVSRDLNAMPLARPGQRPCRAVVRQREPGQGRGIQHVTSAAGAVTRVALDVGDRSSPRPLMKAYMMCVSRAPLGIGTSTPMGKQIFSSRCQ